MSIQSPAARYSKFFTRALPQPDGAEFWFDFGGSLAASIKNQVYGKPDARALGQPSSTEANALGLTAANKVFSGFVSTPNQSFAAVFKRNTSATGLEIVSSSYVAPADAALTQAGALNQYRLTVGANGSTQFVSVSAAGDADGAYIFLCGTVTAARARLYIGRGGVLAPAAETTLTSRTPQAREVSVGQQLSTDISVVSVAAAWSRELAFADVAELYTFMRATSALKGLTVV